MLMIDEDWKLSCILDYHVNADRKIIFRFRKVRVVMKIMKQTSGVAFSMSLANENSSFELFDLYVKE